MPSLDGPASPYLADPAATVTAAFARALTPPPPIDHARWATDHVAFAEDSQFPGPYDPDRFPYAAEILAAMAPDHPAEQVAVRKSAQIGGTILAQIVIGSTLHEAPAPILMVHPTDANARAYAKQKWRPFVRRTTALTRILGGIRQREADQSILYYEREDGRGWLEIVAAGSPAQLSMRSSVVGVFDDLAKWEVNSAGDPEDQADSRFRAAGHRKKVLKVSTPAIDPGCRITRAFLAGDQRYFHVPCPHCGHRHPLEWGQLEPNLDPERPDHAAFTCPACGGRVEEHHRRQIVADGHWVAHNPAAAAALASFHIWTAYSPLESWAAIARAWWQAKGDPDRERVFHNDVLGLAYSVEGEAPDWTALRDRARSGPLRGVIPAETPILLAGADCQIDRVELQLVAFGPRRRRHVVEYLTVDGHIGSPATRAALDDLLAREWPQAIGGTAPITFLAIDGNAYVNEVKAWADRHPQSRVIRVRGDHGEHKPLLSPVQTERTESGARRKIRQRRWWNVGVDPLKVSLYLDLRQSGPDLPGHVSFAAGLPDSFFEGLTAEKRVNRPRANGYDRYVWEVVSGTPNEPLDTMVYAIAGAYRCGLTHYQDADWDRARQAALDRAVQAGLATYHPDLFDPAATQAPAAATPAPQAATPPTGAAPPTEPALDRLRRALTPGPRR